MAVEATTLTLGRGEVYFDPFADGVRVGTGERYIGNTISFAITRTIDRQERWTSARGQKLQREGNVVREAHNVQFTTDNIVIENIGLWYGQEAYATTFLSDQAVTETITVRQDRYFQLGKTVRPSGTRNVTNVVVKIGTTEISMAENYEIDVDFGRLKILANAQDIPDGTTVSVTFEWRTTITENATSKPKDVFGSLRYISTNPFGPLRHYFFPFVRLAPRGGIDLKGDEWQQMSFDAEAMRITPSAAQVYVDGVAYATTTSDEQAIIDGGLTLEEFPYWENELQVLMNITFPGDDIGAPSFP